MFTTRPELQRQLRDGVLDALAGLGGRDGAARSGRQRLRRGRRRRLHAAGRRAASERPGRRPAADLRRPGPAADRAVRSGSGPGRRHRRPLPRPRARPDPGLRPAGRGGARQHGGLAHAAARPRHGHRCARCSSRAIHYADDRHPGAAADRGDDRAGRRPVPRPVADLGGASTSARGEWLRNPAWADTLQRLLDEAEAATADREAQIDARARLVAARLRRRRDRRVRPHAAVGLLRRAARRAC